MIRRVTIRRIILLSFLLWNISAASAVEDNNKQSPTTQLSPSAKLPPLIECPNDTTIEWGTVYIYDVEASDPDNGGSISFSLSGSSPAGAIINPSTGRITWLANDIGACGFNMEVIATDQSGESDSCNYFICVRINPPAFLPCEDTVQFLWGDKATGMPFLDSTIVTLQPLQFYFLDFDGPGFVTVDQATGQWQWQTENSYEFLGDFVITMQVINNSPTCLPCNPEDADTCLIPIHVEPTVRVTIETTEDTPQGRFEYVSVFLSDSSREFGAFSLLLGYDQSILTAVTVSPGRMFTNCGWEYFTYRHSVSSSCHQNCPSGLVRVVGLAELANGPFHPSCFGPTGSEELELARLRFLVTEDLSHECSFVPVNFFWDRCSDNSLSNVLGNQLYIDRRVIGPELNIIWDEQDEELFPESGRLPFVGTPDACLEYDQEKPNILRLIDFTNGGVDLICVDSIDDAGDVNLNGFPFEVADAVLFASYFSYGLAVFTINIDGQIAATDVNQDGTYLSVADLVAMVRVVVGDVLFKPQTTPVEAQLTRTDNGTLIVEECEAGAAFLVVDGEAHPVLLADNMEMTYYFDGSVTRILIASMKGNSFHGEFLRTDGQILSIEMANADGAPVTLKLPPQNFKLHQNYPNPFNPATTIRFNLPNSSEYELTIYNVAGQMVKKFAGMADAGLVEVTWDASEVASGVYFYRLNSGEFSANRRMILLK